MRSDKHGRKSRGDVGDGPPTIEKWGDGPRGQSPSLSKLRSPTSPPLFQKWEGYLKKKLLASLAKLSVPPTTFKLCFRLCLTLYVISHNLWRRQVDGTRKK